MISNEKSSSQNREFRSLFYSPRLEYRYENLILLQKWQNVDSAEQLMKKSVLCCHFLNAYDDIGFSLMFMTYNFRTTYNTSVHIKYIKCKAILHVSKIQLK